MNNIIIYKSVFIEYDFYGQGEYSIQYCGDDFIFNTLEEAKNFVDTEIN